ncbi:MAG: exodeoxyribonuclease VII large subunit [Betaproteobacteria bacterium]|nr:exodeoxyribonuclease VII large subunit [Betaproteobacteria bacterium]
MQQFSDSEKPARVISVAELNRLAKELIEQNLPLMWVAGEISNFTRAASGHCYFSLKDAQAQVRCVMFRHRMQLQDWKPENGMQVEVRACPSFYEQRGEFQLNVEAMRRSGLGALYEAFEKLKARLQAEGLFDAAAKQPLPRFPRAIGVVTSLQAAALRDVLTTLRRRMAAIPVIVYPTAVQGAGAGAQIAAAIGTADARAECDVLIVCRGGGSIEDLWAFNEEVVARAIHACTLPVVSGIGHETDFTIADFVADARAPTPTAAAQMASPNRDDLRQDLSHLYQRLARVTERALERRMQQLDVLARRLTHPGERIANQLAQLGHLASRLRSAWQMTSGNSEWRLRELYQQLLALRPDFTVLATRQQTLAQRLASAAAHRIDALGAEVRSLAAQLAQLNPSAVLERGYSMVETAAGDIVRDSAQLKRDDEVKLTFAQGWARAQVKDKG